MHTLTAEGRTLVEQVAQRHNVSTDAVMALLRALDRGGGTQAQFSHPDLGGMGQWSRGGMIMVGDMFNNGLKARVDQLCNELSDLLNMHTLFTSATQDSSFGGTASGGMSWGGSWWPASFGQPSSSGSQNDMRYACFPETRRLAIQRAGVTTLYDTGDHRIGGVSQQQSGSQDLTFTSQYGTVRLHELALVGDAPVQEPRVHADPPPPSVYAPPPLPQAPASSSQAPPLPPQAPPASPQVPPPLPLAYVAPRAEVPPATMSEATSSDADIFGKIERLHGLHQKGILSEAEFAEKKKELLARL